MGFKRRTLLAGKALDGPKGFLRQPCVSARQSGRRVTGGVQLKILDELVGNSGGPWRWFRAAAIGFAIAFLILFVKAAWVNFTDPRTIDFLSYWAAAKLAVGGHGPLAYDVNVHRQVETTAVSLYGLLPFPYPPPFLLLLLPFGVPSFGIAFPLWVVATGLFYVLASRSMSSPSFALAQPAVFLNEIQGQNGFLTCGIFMFIRSNVSKKTW